jgi:hypothetical protein
MGAMADLLGAIVTRLKNDAPLTAIIGANKVFNNIPEDSKPPYVRVGLGTQNEFSTKGADGFRGELEIDIWSIKRGDKEMLEIQDAIHDALDNIPFTGLPLQSVCLQFVRGVSLIEPDGQSRHGKLFYDHIYMG